MRKICLSEPMDYEQNTKYLSRVYNVMDTYISSVTMAHVDSQNLASEPGERHHVVQPFIDTVLGSKEQSSLIPLVTDGQIILNI